MFEDKSTSNSNTNRPQYQFTSCRPCHWRGSTALCVPFSLCLPFLRKNRMFISASDLK